MSILIDTQIGPDGIRYPLHLIPTVQPRSVADQRIPDEFTRDVELADYVTRDEFLDNGPTGKELAYVENRAANIVTSGTNLTITDMTGLTIVVPASERPVYLRLFISALTVPAAMSVYFSITEVSNGVDTVAEFPGIHYISTVTTGNTWAMEHRLGPTLRDRTFKAVWQKNGTGTAQALTTNNHVASLAAYTR